MPIESQADLATFFNADEFGLLITYTPKATGTPAALVVIETNRDQDASFTGGPRTMRVRRDVLEVLVRPSDLLADPVTGDGAVIGGQAYKVQGAPAKASFGDLWLLKLGRA